jgi:5S rRNA maturation endonuclease (ribonuclease M5)
MRAANLAAALHGRRSGRGYVARCPAHNDSTPSLSITEQNGKILLHCHAGCSQRDVIEALKARGLWESRAKMQPLGRIVAEYSYTDEAGNLLYQVVRFDPKDFRPRYPDGHGVWIWKKHPHQVLYHLPEVLEAAIVFVVEGERDVETLRDHGFVATTNAGGARAPWLPQYTEALRGREAILIPDADEAGRRRVLTISRALLGKAARIIVWDPEDGKDITEWFERGHSEVELTAQVEGEAVNR